MDRVGEIDTVLFLFDMGALANLLMEPILKDTRHVLSDRDGCGRTNCLQL